jgi:hypothetical protein
MSFSFRFLDSYGSGQCRWQDGQRNDGDIADDEIVQGRGDGMEHDHGEPGHLQEGGGDEQMHRAEAAQAGAQMQTLDIQQDEQAIWQAKVLQV